MRGSAPGEIRFDEAASVFHLEVGGVPLARMERFGAPPLDVVLFHPRVEGDVDALAAAAALVGAGVRQARERGVARVGLLLEDRRAHAAAFVAAAPDWGFTLDAEKVLVRAAKDDLRLGALPLPPPGAAFVAHDPEIAAVFQRVLAAATTQSDRESIAADEIAGFEARCRGDGCFFAEDWVVLRTGGAAAGVVFPAFLDAKHDGGTLFYVGVVPEFRGRGLGAVLTRHGVETMLSRGATRYADSCNAKNAPMRRIFERLGCGVVTAQHFFVRQLASVTSDASVPATPATSLGT